MSFFAFASFYYGGKVLPGLIARRETEVALFS